MISFLRAERLVHHISERANRLSAAAVVLMMMLTTADVIMRFFRHPIPGTYEMVGFLGAVVIAFALPYTSIQKGHIAVEFLVQKFPRAARIMINALNAFVSTILFAVVFWQSVKYAHSLKLNGEVSPTLQMPVYPVVYGVAVGCALLCLVLLMEFIRQLRGAEIE